MLCLGVGSSITAEALQPPGLIYISIYNPPLPTAGGDGFLNELLTLHSPICLDLVYWVRLGCSKCYQKFRSTNTSGNR